MKKTYLIIFGLIVIFCSGYSFYVFFLEKPNVYVSKYYIPYGFEGRLDIEINDTASSRKLRWVGDTVYVYLDSCVFSNTCSFSEYLPTGHYSPNYYWVNGNTIVELSSLEEYSNVFDFGFTGLANDIEGNKMKLYNRIYVSSKPLLREEFYKIEKLM